MENTINITITENAVLAHALYEVINKHYTEDAGDIVYHSGSSNIAIMFLLKNPSAHCSLNYASGDMIEFVNNEWKELLTDREIKWESFIEDTLYYVSDYDPEYSYEDDSQTVYTNAGKVLILANKYFAGKTDSPYDILNSLDDSECYDTGKTNLQTYETNKARFDERSDDSNSFFENVEYFGGGYIEPVSDSYRYSFNFNESVYTSQEVVFYNLDINKNCINKFTISPDNLESIVLVKKNIQIVDQAEFAYCKFLLTTNDGVRFLVTTKYLIEE